ncbi:glucosaminidase domain-containing protein [Brevibacillus porteri]|uniref:Mannosyl-glycoprotein endo-beta-N-acetylglucosamidase-like domain-containing protein n=1 Tax=Brevibacillus porteri TaxID=2126350 RepID=A0ABX5FFQ9_9BACL|nr:glucosaminidase domain-containing protein [Brevibacillus porteri]MED1803008.1 glucosaminidase domain-containing protein [Brevibacillus porteri]MED2135116.1 glucosaminidase domain-containing protein [Brevibacillus porteri]MED2745758.1 glucosaminidase domain-containing protein [Brevibacillus porteri]MED2813778.1 glucosaminidase domain-containing protein [Brevibacillus porteri]MED2897786.1 glucosaminidase domain-containing protein [Brevibacillus porteri]
MKKSLAQEEMKRSGVPASLTIAQAILESGWGTSELATKANNLFGIKGTGPAGIYQKVSPEYVDSKRIEKSSDFRKYNTWQESIEDHTAKLLEPKYAKVVGASYIAACHAVQDAEYATDPNYAQELIKRIEKYKLYQYDLQGGQIMPLPILIIDPGHGGSDPGVVGANGLKEKDLNLQISLYQYARFQSLGVPVILTRASDIALTPERRTKLVRESGAKFCISNHINAGGGDGAETIYSIHSDGKLANKIAEALSTSGQNVRRVFSRQGKPNYDYYFMHRQTGNVETVIVEYGFIDSKQDDVEQIQRDWKIWSESIVKNFCDFIGVPYKSPAENPQPDKKPVDKPVDKVSIEVNGKALPVQGYLNNGVSTLPVRAVSEAAGVTPGWCPDNKAVTVNGKQLTVTIGAGTSYAPAREIAAALAMQVEWIQETRTVKLKG